VETATGFLAVAFLKIRDPAEKNQVNITRTGSELEDDSSDLSKRQV
jgi:hypothetical protein